MKKIFQAYYDLLIIFLLTIANETLLRYFCNLPLFSLQALLFNLSFFFLIAGILNLFKPKGRRISNVIIVSISSIYAFAQSFHYAYFKTFFSFRKLTVGGELINVVGEIFDKWNPLFVLFLVPIIIAVLIKPKENPLMKKWRILILGLCLLISALGRGAITLYLSNDYISSKKSWQKDYYLLRVMHNKSRYIQSFGLSQYISKDLELSFKSPEKLSADQQAELETFNTKYSATESNSLTGQLKGKNLIMILCESFDEKAILSDLTPNLYALAKDSIYFDNYYAPIYQVATGDSEFICQTGMIPSIEYGTTSYTFHLNHYPNALANLLKAEGYHVNSYHSYISNFYNRETIHESFGFETFYDMDKLGLGRFDGYKDTLNWIEDTRLFDGMLKNTNFEEPFYNFVITASGHMPYRRSRKELKGNLEIIDGNPKYQNLDDETKAYYASQMLLDQGIKTLINGLKAKGELEDTVIILFGDHYPYGISSQTAKNNILEDEDAVDVYRVPFMIYGSGLEASINSTLCSSFDLYPTITNLFGLNSDKYYKVGSDVFDLDAERFVLFEDGSILAENFYYASSSDTLDTYKEDISAEYDRISNKARELLNYSQDILIADYYKDEGE